MYFFSLSNTVGSTLIELVILKMQGCPGQAGALKIFWS